MGLQSVRAGETLRRYAGTRPGLTSHCTKESISPSGALPDDFVSYIAFSPSLSGVSVAMTDTPFFFVIIVTIVIGPCPRQGMAGPHNQAHPASLGGQDITFRLAVDI